MKKRFRYRVLLVAATLTTAAGVGAQGPGQGGRWVNSAPVPDGQAEVFEYRAATVVETRITTGRPYTAEAVTEFTQMLGDGNKIARKTTVRIFRDSDGRTRREELAADGAVKSISIYDPVAHVTYVLDPATRTARKSAVRVAVPEKFVVADDVKLKLEEKITAEREAGAYAGRVAVVPVPLPAGAGPEVRQRVVEPTGRGAGGGVGPGRPLGGAAQNAKEESLGQKLVEGVMADGKRVTTTLPAGVIGNQAPITVLSEQWFSSDLEILVSTRHSDPRSGETSYTLSNIVRAEPPANLFELPQDYTIVESRYMRSPAQQ